MQRIILFIAVIGFVGAVVFSVLSLPDKKNRPLPIQDRPAQAQKAEVQEPQPRKERAGAAQPAPSPAPVPQARAEKPPNPAPAPQPSPAPELNRLRQQIEELNREKKILTQRALDLEMKLARAEETGKPVQESQDQIRVTPEESITLTISTLFKPGPVELSQSGEEILAKVAEKFKEKLKSVPQALIRVEGHSDDTALGAEKKDLYVDNLGLSAIRALIVGRQLIKEGINPRRISVAGFGEFQPAASNETTQGQAKNRRVVIKFIPGKG